MHSPGMDMTPYQDQMRYSLAAFSPSTLRCTAGVSADILSATVSSGLGYRQVGGGKSGSKRTLSSPTEAMRAGTLFFSNQKVAKSWRLKYSEGNMESLSSSFGAFSDIS